MPLAVPEGDRRESEHNDGEEGLVMSTFAPADSVDSEVIDRASVLQRFEGDFDFLREIAALFLADCPKRLAAVRAALAERDYGALQDLAHSFKGSVANFAAAAAVASAQRLEQIARQRDSASVEVACSALEREIGRLEAALSALL
jgi:HPt (histidine-containing phosphotransfer) domain-containing protein